MLLYATVVLIGYIKSRCYSNFSVKCITYSWKIIVDRLFNVKPDVRNKPYLKLILFRIHTAD